MDLSHDLKRLDWFLHNPQAWAELGESFWKNRVRVKCWYKSETQWKADMTVPERYSLGPRGEGQLVVTAYKSKPIKTSRHKSRVRYLLTCKALEPVEA